MYVNEAARLAMNSIEPLFHAPGRPPITPEVHLGEPDPVIYADADMLRMALQNLMLDCLDAMPSGGTLVIRTKEKDGTVRIEISAKGAALGAQECSRLFIPGSSNPEGMTGLGLATAQAAVIDLGGQISAESAPDGATFRLEFKAAPAGVKPPVPPPDPVDQPRQLTAGTPQLPAAEAERPAAEAPTALEEPATPPAAGD
jgi:signal transduction histidine kinase